VHHLFIVLHCLMLDCAPSKLPVMTILGQNLAKHPSKGRSKVGQKKKFCLRRDPPSPYPRFGTAVPDPPWGESALRFSPSFSANELFSLNTLSCSRLQDLCNTPTLMIQLFQYELSFLIRKIAPPLFTFICF
jgi:hypothetical protein